MIVKRTLAKNIFNKFYKEDMQKMYSLDGLFKDFSMFGSGRVFFSGFGSGQF